MCKYLNVFILETTVKMRKLRKDAERQPKLGKLRVGYV